MVGAAYLVRLRKVRLATEPWYVVLTLAAGFPFSVPDAAIHIESSMVFGK